MISHNFARRALRGLRHPWLQRLKTAVLARYFRRRHVAPGSHVDRTAHVLGWRAVRIGRNSIISADCWLNVNHFDGFEVRLAVGDFCHVGRRNVLSSARLLRLGDYCLTGPDCRFLGSDHVHADPFLPYASTGATCDGVIQVGANCWFGAGVAVIGNVTIGHGSVFGAHTLVNCDIPPFSVVVGNPARIVKRYAVPSRCWVAGRALTDEEERALPDETAYLEMLRARRPGFDMPLAAASRSMGDTP